MPLWAAVLLTVLAVTAAFVSPEEHAGPPSYKNATDNTDLVEDCILAGGRSSCMDFPKAGEECINDLENDEGNYTVHFLLGPMKGVDLLLNTTLASSVGTDSAGVHWYVQNRSTWDDSLLDLTLGRNSFYDGLVVDPAIAPDMVASGALLNLEPFLLRDRWRGQSPGILAALRLQIATMRNSVIPLGAAAMVLHYREDVLAAHNLEVPRTWEQLLRAASTVHGKPGGPKSPTDVDFYGFCTMPVAGCHANAYELIAIWASFIQTSGAAQGAFFDPETFTPLVQNDGMRAALLYYRHLGALGPPHHLASTSDCSSMYGTAEALYETGKCGFQIAPHPSHKRNMLLSPSAAVRQFTRVTQLPGATSVLDRPTGLLVPCSVTRCPFAEVVPQWAGDEAVVNAVLREEAATVVAAALLVPLQPSPGTVLMNVAPVLGLSPLALGINNHTSLMQKAHSVKWLRLVTDPETVWKVVVSPETPLAPFRYEHFNPSNKKYWTDAGYDEATVDAYLSLSYTVLTHGNLVSFPLALQRMLEYRAALHTAAYNLSLSLGLNARAVMGHMAAVLALTFGPSSYGFGTLRLQYLLSIARSDLLDAPPPPPPPPPPHSVRYYVGHEVRPPGVSSQGLGVAIGGAIGATAVAGLLALTALLYKRLLVDSGWGMSKDPGVGRATTLVVTDIEASTVMWEELDALVMDVALSLHHDTIRRVIAQFAGYESVTEGDSFTVAFHSAEAAVSFSLAVQSELMEQSWPNKVLTHDACRQVHVIGCKRLRHLVSKLPTKRPTVTSTEVVESELAGASAAIPSGNVRSSGHEAIAGNGGGGDGEGSTSAARQVHPRSFSKATRRIDMLSGLSIHLQRSMSFLSRPRLYLSQRGISLAPTLAGSATAGSGGSALAARASTTEGVHLDVASSYEAMALSNSRNIFDHFLPYSFATPVPMRVGSVGVAVSSAAAAGSVTASLSLGKLPAVLLAANASGAGGATATGNTTGTGFVFGALVGRTPSAAGRILRQASLLCPDSCDETEMAGLPASSEVDSARLDASITITTATATAGRITHGTSGIMSCPSSSPQPPQPLASSLLHATTTAATSTIPHTATTSSQSPPMLCSLLSARTALYGTVASVPEEPSVSPSALASRCVIRRTQSTVGLPIRGGHREGSGAGGDEPPAHDVASSLHGMRSGSGILGPAATLRSPFKSFCEGAIIASGFRRPSRLADPPPPILSTLQLDDRDAGGSGGIGDPAVSGHSPYLYRGGEVSAFQRHSDTTAADAAEVVAGGSGADGYSNRQRTTVPYAHTLRERHILDEETAGRIGDRSLRAWRSWTGSSLSFFRRMQRSVRQMTSAAVAAAGTPRFSFSTQQRSADVASITDAGAGIGGSGPGIVISTAAEIFDAASRDAAATAAGWEVESRSSSVSHGTPSSNISPGSTIQSTLQLQPSHHGRRGGGASGSKPIYVSPSTYGSQLRSTWTELPCNLGVNPASVGAVLVFRGFRVRCGIHSGVATPAEVNRNHPSGRTRYSGPALLAAKAVSDAAHGGMIFASRHTVSLLSPAFLADGRVVLWRLGDHVLGAPRMPATLFHLSNTALVLRAALQRPLTRTYMPLGLGLLDAPLSVAACAAIRLASMCMLEQAPASVSIEVASVFQALSYQYARMHGGYLAQLGVCRSLCVFADGYRAALWAALVQEGMASYSWSTELLAMPYCGPRGVLDSKGRELQVAQGPQIQAVVHFGPVSTLLHPLNGQLSYDGGTIDTTLRVLNNLNTTGVVATQEAATSLRRYRPADAARWQQHQQRAAAASGTSLSRCRIDVEGGGGEGTGSASPRSSGVTWREMFGLTRQPQLSLAHNHNHNQQQQQQQQQHDSPAPRTKSSVGLTAAEATAGRPRSSPDGLLAVATADAPAAPATGSPIWPGRYHDGLRGGSEARCGAAPRAASLIKPTGTESSNTSGTEATDGISGGAAGSSRGFGHANSGSTVGAATPSVHQGSGLNLCITLNTVTPFQDSTGNVPSTIACGDGGYATSAAATTTTTIATTAVASRVGGDVAARAPPLAATATNDSLLLLLTLSGELSQTGVNASFIHTGGGGVGVRGSGSVNVNGGQAVLAWMASGGGAMSSAVTSVGWAPSGSYMDPNAGADSNVQPGRSSGGAGADMEPGGNLAEMLQPSSPAPTVPSAPLPTTSSGHQTTSAPEEKRAANEKRESTNRHDTELSVVGNHLKTACLGLGGLTRSNPRRADSRTEAVPTACQTSIRYLASAATVTAATPAATVAQGQQPRTLGAAAAGILTADGTALRPAVVHANAGPLPGNVSSVPSDSTEASSDPDMMTSAAMVLPPALKRSSPPRKRQLHLQRSARDNSACDAIGSQRFYQSFTFGQTGRAMARPRLQDLLFVNPYDSSSRVAPGTARLKADVSDVQPSHGAVSHYGAQALGRIGGSTAAVDGRTRSGGDVAGAAVERGDVSAEPPGRFWGGDLQSSPSTRTGYSAVQSYSSLEALIRGPHGRMSRSFTLTTHRRSPLAVSSYAGDPVVGAGGSAAGSAAGCVGGTPRPMSSLSRVFYGTGAAVGLVNRESAATAPDGYNASHKTPSRGISQEAQGAAAFTVSAASVNNGMPRLGSREASTRVDTTAAPSSPGGNVAASCRHESIGSLATTTNTTAAAPAVIGITQVPRSTSWSRRIIRGRHASLTHIHAAAAPVIGDPSSSDALVSYPCGEGTAQGYATGAAGVSTTTGTASGMLPFAMPSDYLHTSTSVGKLPVCAASVQIRRGNGEIRTVVHDGRGSSGVSASALPPNLDTLPMSSASMVASWGSTAVGAMVAVAAGGPLHAPLSSLPSGVSAQLSGLLTRVRSSMANSRSRSLSRPIVTSATPEEATSSPTPGTSPHGGSGPGSVRHDTATIGSVGVDASSASARLLGPSQFPSGSSGGGGSGGGGGVAAAVSRTLRGLMQPEKLPTLPESNLAPLMREVRHLRLRLVPIRLATRGGTVKGSATSIMAAAAAERAAYLAESNVCALHEHEHEQHRRRRKGSEFNAPRIPEYIQVYRVSLLPANLSSLTSPYTPPSLPTPTLINSTPAGSAAAARLATATAQGALATHRQQPQPPLQPQQEQPPQQFITASQTHSSNPPATTSSHSQVQVRLDNEPGLISASASASASVPEPHASQHTCEILPSAETELPSQYVLSPSNGSGGGRGSGSVAGGRSGSGDTEDRSRVAALVTQFLNGFADLSDPQLAELWVAQPGRSLLQDRGIVDVLQLRAMLATETAQAEGFKRDNLF